MHIVPNIVCLQGKPGALGQVVAVLKAVYELDHIYVWHGLSAYWSGMSHEEPGVAKYKPRLVFADPTPGLQEVEPAMAWNPSVTSGIGVPADMGEVYRDMHTYLANAGGLAYLRSNLGRDVAQLCTLLVSADPISSLQTQARALESQAGSSTLQDSAYSSSLQTQARALESQARFGSKTQYASASDIGMTANVSTVYRNIHVW